MAPTDLLKRQTCTDRFGRQVSCDGSGWAYGTRAGVGVAIAAVCIIVILLILCVARRRRTKAMSSTQPWGYTGQGVQPQQGNQFGMGGNQYAGGQQYYAEAQPYNAGYGQQGGAEPGYGYPPSSGQDQYKPPPGPPPADQPYAAPAQPPPSYQKEV